MQQPAWRDAEARDRAAFQQFECTAREKRKLRTHYPRPWEREVEAAVRTANPRCDGQSAVRVYEDAEGIGAVVSVALCEAPDLYIVELVAVAMRHRNSGGEIASAALEEAVQWVINHADAAGCRRPRVMGRVDNRNNASKHMLRAYGFVLVPTDDDHEVWVYDIDLRLA